MILGLIKLSCLCNRPIHCWDNEWNKWYYAKFISNMFLINYLFLLIILHAELHIFGYWVLKKKCLGICNECQIIFADCSDTSYQLFNLWSALTDRLTRIINPVVHILRSMETGFNSFECQKGEIKWSQVKRKIYKLAGLAATFWLSKWYLHYDFT